MIIKMFEIRDEGTCIPAMGIRMTPRDKLHCIDRIEQQFLWRGGYPSDGSAIILMRLNDQVASVDPCSWSGRTMPAAHRYIYDNFDELMNGQVVDVEVILKEKETPSEPEVMRRQDYGQG